jgi:hypothetical protein
VTFIPPPEVVADDVFGDFRRAAALIVHHAKGDLGDS